MINQQSNNLTMNLCENYVLDTPIKTVYVVRQTV